MELMLSRLPILNIHHGDKSPQPRVARRFEAKAAADLEASQRLKGEHGILRRRFLAVEKETQALRDQIKTLMAQKAQAAQVRLCQPPSGAWWCIGRNMAAADKSESMASGCPSDGETTRQTLFSCPTSPFYTSESGHAAINASCSR